ncbi:hypothetical protein N24_1857 [Corynebacterium suranareeae]|uniref:Uncharacterized protein n=1 Tax=Corynebacterium suranareeae TaxID=2506452 RepID=A0A160PQ81_9CORY|nr:hypothetical protein [Corynebacterium suranareeae]BAU96119.1 hypothetical protein N24_1857 [Corynebacterium suranareeae]
MYKIQTSSQPLHDGYDNSKLDPTSPCYCDQEYEDYLNAVLMTDHESLYPTAA